MYVQLYRLGVTKPEPKFCDNRVILTTAPNSKEPSPPSESINSNGRYIHYTQTGGQWSLRPKNQSNCLHRLRKACMVGKANIRHMKSGQLSGSKIQSTVLNALQIIGPGNCTAPSSCPCSCLAVERQSYSMQMQGNVKVAAYQFRRLPEASS